MAYFDQGGARPTRGLAELTVEHDGVRYRFANEEHRALFLSDPARFEPAYGGWCSYAMGAKNEQVEVDLEAFRLTDGQLHLFFNGFWADTREPWDEDTAALKRAADANWSRRMDKAGAP